jgi:GT2 family glycosyltransferase
MDVTIILPTFDRRHVLERTLGCYQALARRHALLVVDDGSHDGTAEWLRGLGLTVARHPRRLGLPAARNTGLTLAKTEWVFFGEDDVMVPTDHIDRLLAEAARLPRCGAVAGQLFSGSSWSLPEQRPPASAGPLLDQRTLRGDFAAPLPHALPLPSLHACALVNRQAALAVGGYDEAFAGSAFREESDFYGRLWRSGLACWLTPATWAVHVRHRLGGGCRGEPGLAKIANRWSYARNDARFSRRHAALWRRWGTTDGHGRLALRGAWRVATRACAALLGPDEREPIP